MNGVFTAWHLKKETKIIGWSFVDVVSEIVKGTVALLTNKEERDEARLFFYKELAKMEVVGLKGLRQKLLQNIGTKKYQEKYWKFFKFVVNLSITKISKKSVNQ